MICKKGIISSVYMLVQVIVLFGQQPATIPLDRNIVLQERQPMMLKRAMQVDTINLPFFDDFSYYSQTNYPKPTLWTDRYVFINNDYPDQPRSNGVATFDALDADGALYKSTAPRFPADTLTSCPVDLGVSGLGGVYLSFFYQPQGYGDNPEPGDSLILQFKSPVTKQWRTIWHTPGTTLQPFKQVLLPVEGEYLRKGFQFRFVNLVSLEQDKFNPGRKSNADHWHIDYVRMDKDRDENDTATLDVAMISPIKSLIKGYQSIPWNQMRYAAKTRLEPKIAFTYRNNDNLDHFVSRYFTTTDMYSNITTDLAPGGGENIDANSILQYSQDIANPFYSQSTDSALFELEGYLGTDQFDRKENDTVRFYQFFKNFFARDDGVPESGYGYSGINAQDCAIACRYETFVPDSLRAVRLYFNPTDKDTSAQYRFKIAVWRDDNGRPGQQVYLSTTEYSPKVTGKFITYTIGKPIYVTKYYWVGWQQVTSGFLNAGFDRNYNDKGNLWYNSSGAWQQDVNDGTLMIRPAFGTRADFPTSVKVPEVDVVSMKIYPNPVTQHIRIEMAPFAGTEQTEYVVEIYGLTGRLFYRGAYTGEMIDIGHLEPGLYMVRLLNRKSGRAQTQKIVVYR